MLHRRPDCRLFDLAADKRLEFGEVRCETPGQFTRRFVIGLFVGPSATRIEHLTWHVGAALGYKDSEIGVFTQWCTAEPAVERCAQECTRMSDRHALAGAVGAA